MKKLIIFISFGLVIYNPTSQAQTSPQLSKNDLLGQRNVVTTSVPFLSITPDSRGAGMGDVGVATSPDANSIHYNVAKLAFAKDDGAISVSAAPWLKVLVPDIWFYYLSGYKKVGQDRKSAVGGSIRYFTLGEIQFTDDAGINQQLVNPLEFAAEVNYSRQLSDYLSLGVGIRFIYSDLARGASGASGQEIKVGLATAGDLGMFYTKPIKINGSESQLSLGANISNIGNKITYTTSSQKDFIPTNLKIGGNLALKLDQHNDINFSLDINKLLVPTRPSFLKNHNGQDSILNGQRIIQYGNDTDVPVIKGIFSSFVDAPAGFKEEIKEYMLSLGVEYWYDKQFAIRAGVFNEAKLKGGRQYATFGIGLKYNIFGIDIAYLQPFSQRHPLQNTIRFSMNFNLSAFKNQR